MQPHIIAYVSARTATLDRMRRIGSIHTFEDRAFLSGIARASVAVLAAGVLVALGWYLVVSALSASSGVPLEPFELRVALGGLGARLMGESAEAASRAHIDFAWWFLLVAASLAALAVHELVHALCFKRYAPAGSRVTFGANWRLGMLYASAEGIVYRRQQYLVIALAPSVAVTALLVALGIGLKWPLWTIAVATVHLSGCTGDWGYARAILRDPSIAYCEDTSWGVEFYGDDAPMAATGEAGAGREVVPGAAGAEAADAEDGGSVDAARAHAVPASDTGPGFAGAAGADTPASSALPAESDASASASFTVVDGGKSA